MSNNNWVNLNNNTVTIIPDLDDRILELEIMKDKLNEKYTNKENIPSHVKTSLDNILMSIKNMKKFKKKLNKIIKNKNLTKEEKKNEIDRIIKKYERTGDISNSSNRTSTRAESGKLNRRKTQKKGKKNKIKTKKQKNKSNNI